MKGIEGLTLGRYELRRRIAQGGMAEVYLGYDRRVRRKVAVKVLYGRDEAFVRRFEREASAVGTLSHDHILPLYDFGEQRPWYYLVMPYIEGGNLRDYLLRRKRLTLEEAGSFIEQVASALQYAHDHGVVHRDVKPSNILLRPDGYAYLVDFGLAKAMMGAESLTTEGAMVGTPEYMAPEQSNGLNDYRSDIYSLGIILYQLLTGRVPFIADSPVAILLKHIQATPIPPRELNSEIPPGVEAVILKAIAKDPGERYQEAQTFSIAYWNALEREQTCNSACEASPSSALVRGQGESSEEAPTEYTVRSVTTLVLPETERELVRPPITPRLFPLIVDRPAPAESPSTPGTGRRRGIRRRQMLRFAQHDSPIQGTGRRRGIRPVRSTLILLVCLIAVLSAIPLGTAWQVLQSRKLSPGQKTQLLAPQQQVDLTATAAVQAKIQATLAAQSRAQATAGITSAISTGNVLYSDDLTGPGGGWIDDGYQCYFSPQGYHVQTSLTHEVGWCYSNQQEFSDLVLTAQAQLLHGDIYGLIFRLQPESREFYVLEINSRGEYRFVRALGNNPLNWLTLIDWTPSSAIVSGYGQVNTFLVLVRGSNFRFYMNKQLILTSFSDTTYTSGLIGFLVGGDSAGGTAAIFSNVWVFQT